ncbi:hypothetical protein J2S61_003202 [Microbacterium barkeri]|nr:hypothetical protein [Microbacterium barkeri]
MLFIECSACHGERMALPLPPRKTS